MSALMNRMKYKYVEIWPLELLEQDHNNRTKIKPEIKIWLDENIKNHFYVECNVFDWAVLIAMSRKVKVFFENEDDLTLFALTWT